MDGLRQLGPAVAKGHGEVEEPMCRAERGARPEAKKTGLLERAASLCRWASHRLARAARRPTQFPGWFLVPGRAGTEAKSPPEGPYAGAWGFVPCAL